MTTSTVNLVVKVPLALRRQAQAAAVIRGETVSDVVRHALAECVARVEEEDDIRFADAVMKCGDHAPLAFAALRLKPGEQIQVNGQSDDFLSFGHPPNGSGEERLVQWRNL